MADNEKNLLTIYSQFLDASGEHLTYAALSTYRNSARELSQKEKDFFKNHLDSCTSCSARLQEIAEVEGEILVEQPKNILNFYPNLFRYAIAAILVIAVGITIVVVIQNPQQEQITSQQILPQQPLAEVTLDPAKFVPNQMLENFIGRNVRSSSEVKFLSPSAGDTLSSPFTIRWTANKLRYKYTLVIVDNNNAEQTRQTTSLTKLVISKKLSSGLFYLKLEADGKLAQVSKFIVIR